MKKNKKIMLTIMSVIAFVLITIGITYAYWLVTRTQKERNAMLSACLDIDLAGTNDINLTNQFPMSDEDGMKLVPYEFTITNKCITTTNYIVALELLGIKSESINSSAIKVSLNSEIPVLLSEKEKIVTTIDEAYASHKLLTGNLLASGKEGSSVTYKLYLWIDAEAPISEMNKTFRSKITVLAGQINKTGTLANAILANYGGEEAIQSTSEYEDVFIENKDVSINKSTSYLYGSDYDFDETTGLYKLTGDIVAATILECRAGQKTDGTTISCGKYSMNTTSQNVNSSYIYEIKSLTSTKADSSIYTTYMNADRRVSIPETGMYKTEDDLGTSYYLRGSITNNYVKFGTYAEDLIEVRGYYSSNSTSYQKYATLDECNSASNYNYNCEEVILEKKGEPMYWRVLRINGDGTIRLAYDGSKAFPNGSTEKKVTIGESAINYSELISGISENLMGYTYNDNGTKVDSQIKKYLDAWYEKTLKTDYGKYIADEIFCNDREIASTAEEGDTSWIYYSGHERLWSGTSLLKNIKPKLTCNKTDRYTMSEDIGNGLLSNPVGLLTADEVALAGGASANVSDSKIYLTGSDLEDTSGYVTMTPAQIVAYESDSMYLHSFFNVSSMGELYNDYIENVDWGFGVRPVINLKSSVQFTGDGTINSPYEIVTN